MPSLSFDSDDELARYFTDVEHLRGTFADLVAAPTLSKHLVVIHGVGGVGKTSLLQMFRRHCRNAKVPVALASGGEAKSVPDVLALWANDLKAGDIKCSSFSKILGRFRAVEAKVYAQANKAQATQSRTTEVAHKAASRTVEAAASALGGAAIGSIFPGPGTLMGGLLGGLVGGLGAEEAIDWLRGFLPGADIELFLDQGRKQLTGDFLADLAKAAKKQRIVLMLDTIEQLPVFNIWTCGFAQRLHGNALLVIAGRVVPDWNTAWPTWRVHAQVEALEPMSEATMRDLVHRFYRTMREGEPDAQPVEAIIGSAHGLPLAVTCTTHLWVDYKCGIENVQSAKRETVGILVKRLLGGVPPSLVPVLQAAAAVRWFDQPLLRALTGLADVHEVYEELGCFPAVRKQAEGLALHDAVRCPIDDDLRTNDSERHRQLHERAASYFETRLVKATGQEAERLGLEWLYHRVRQGEEAGIRLFQETAEELVRYRLVNQLRTLLNDVNTYPLELEECRLWAEYYGARLAFIEARYNEAERMLLKVSSHAKADPRLRAYALCDLGEIWARPERLAEPEGAKRALDALAESQRLGKHLDSKLVLTYAHFRMVYHNQAKWDKAIEATRRQCEYYSQNNDNVGVAIALGVMTDEYGIMGDWRRAAEASEKASMLVDANSHLPSHRFDWWYLAWSGQYAKSEQVIRERIAVAEHIGDINDLTFHFKDLGLVLALEGKYREGLNFIEQAAKRYQQRGIEWSFENAMMFGFWGIVLLKQGQLAKAENMLCKGLSMKQRIGDSIGIPEICDALGELHESKAQDATQAVRDAELNAAASHYQSSIDLLWVNRRHYRCGALTGLVRVKHALGDLTAIPTILAEAELIAQQYEYNDHLASLRLTQGHMAWMHTTNTRPPSGQGSMASPLSHYQHALIHAMRYNRFLLDEVLGGRPQGTPLAPIIPFCLAQGDEGRKVLASLRDWWQTGNNDIGIPRPDTISPLPESIPLLEAERIAREREPGDGSPQRSVIEQLQAALANGAQAGLR